MQSVTFLWAVLGVCVVIYEINCIVMCMRPKMAIKIRIHKVEPMLVIGRVSLFM